MDWIQITVVAVCAALGAVSLFLGVRRAGRTGADRKAWGEILSGAGILGLGVLAALSPPGWQELAWFALAAAAMLAGSALMGRGKDGAPSG